MIAYSLHDIVRKTIGAFQNTYIESKVIAIRELTLIMIIKVF